MSQGTGVLFASKEAKLCIDVIHPVVETAGNKSKKGKLVIVPFILLSVELEMQSKRQDFFHPEKQRVA